MSVCQKCHKEFKYNYLLKRHMNKKIDCSNIQNNNIFEDNNEIIDIKLKIKQNQEEINKIDECIKNSINKPNNINKCNFCNKESSSKSNLARHMKYYCSLHKNLLEKQYHLKNECINLETSKEKKINDLINIKRDIEMKQMRLDIEKLLNNNSPNINITHTKIIMK